VLKGAFIGFGNVAANGHWPGWRAREDVQIVAATDAAASRREAFLAACPDGRWYGTVDDLLAGEKLDFVDICAPPGSHAALIERALDAGLHVLSEKPLVTRVEDAKRVGAASVRVGRVLHTVHNWLEAPICRQISALVDEGAIGAVRSVRWWTLRTQPAIAVSADGVTNWRVDPAMAGGGILFDHGWHAIYCVMRWAGAPVGVAAQLETRRFHEHPLEDTASVDLDTALGVSSIYLTWAADERSNTIEIEGEEGDIRVVGDAMILTSSSQEQRWSCPPSLSEGSHHPDWFGGVAADFVAAATGGAKSNLDQAILCAQVIDTAQRSSAGGGVRKSLTG
jgi:predicted dehydrogenase